MSVFKICPKCRCEWKTKDDFLLDKTVFLNGYQPYFQSLELGFFLFTHEIENCKSTCAIKVEEILPSDLLLEVKGKTIVPFQGKCKGYCTDNFNLQDCENTNCQGQVLRKFMHYFPRKSSFV